MVARLAAIREARGFGISNDSDWDVLSKDLLDCGNPLLDAKGRPTFVEMRNAELSRKLMLDGPGRVSDSLDSAG